MTNSQRNDFLVEVGTEELPPKALRSLMLAFAENFERLLAEHRLEHDSIQSYASPRRLALLVPALADRQPDREVEAKGPPVRIAFDENGTPKPAAIAFAKKCGVGVDALERVNTPKGEWLSFRSTEEGLAANALLAGLVERALQGLPIPRRMRWGDSDVEFVRPVHWLLMLNGDAIVPGTVLGHAASNVTRGHRFMSSGDIVVASPSAYLDTLERAGFVIADFDRREARVREQVLSAASAAKGTIVADDSLYEEVAALTEWPVAMTGRFDESFLELPAEAVTASLTGHQRYFPIADNNGNLLSSFVVVANLESKNPSEVREGNERVIRPRLADAVFFWETDRKTSLEDRVASLGRVVYQRGLGSMLEKSLRVQSLCRFIAKQLGIDDAAAARAAELAKCDLMTGMVGEFPELQGVMGGYYATADGEIESVSTAIREQYLPRFAGDEIPASSAGQVLALADKLDTLAGIFALGKKPSGNKDPFGLRRAALGIVRILIDKRLEVNLLQAVTAAVTEQPTEDATKAEATARLYAFITDRLRSFFVEQPGVSAEIFDAVAHAEDRDAMALPDFDQRVQAVVTFVSMSEAESLASANKRISNILQQSGDDTGTRVDTDLFVEEAERSLYKALDLVLGDVRPLQEQRDYAGVLARLAQLRDPVDRFFDEVMVMAEDEALRNNRLALLSMLREPFHSVADISRLSVSKSQS